MDLLVGGPPCVCQESLISSILLLLHPHGLEPYSSSLQRKKKLIETSDNLDQRGGQQGTNNSGAGGGRREFLGDRMGLEKADHVGVLSVNEAGETSCIG